MKCVMKFNTQHHSIISIVSFFWKFIPRINHEHTDWGYFDVGDLPSPINKWVKETIEND